MSWGYVAVGAATVVSGAISSRSAKKQRNAQQRAQDAQMAQMDEQMARLDAFMEKVPEQSKEMIERLNASQAEINLLLEQAKVKGDQQAAELYARQRELVQSHLTAELDAIGLNAAEVTGVIDELSSNAVRLVNEDADANEILQENYKKETEGVMENLGKMAEISGRRLESIDKTGLTPEAAARISQVQQGVADLSRKTKAIEAKVGRGGSASRVSATELEGLKTLGEVTANLQEDVGRELERAGQVQGLVLGGAAERMSNLRRTRGRDELIARQPFDAAKVTVAEQAGRQSLAALGNANVETRNLTGAEGEASLAREDQFARDRMSLVQSGTAAEQAISEREQELELSGITKQASVSRSMADIMGVMAQNYANMAAKSSAQATKFFGTAVKGTAAGAAASNPFSKDFNAQDFGKGFTQGAFNIDTGVFNS